MSSRNVVILLAVFFCLVSLAMPASAQMDDLTDAEIDSVYADMPEFIRNAGKKIGLVWHGERRYLTFEEVASYAAPMLWFSPDEPLLGDSSGKDIRIPSAFPFEEQPDAPVTYYRLKTIMAHPFSEGAVDVLDDIDPARYDTMIDLYNTTAIDLDYFFYYSSEEGLAAHPYDVEKVEMKLLVIHPRAYPELGYWIVVQKITGKAHGIIWYDNILEVDKYTKLPASILVEEGKHASCTDKNADGEYSPGFDVSTQVNDAWGVRDNMRSGTMFTGGFTSWMAKTRTPEYRVFPPLPEDSPLRERYTENGVYAPDNAIYELRPFPRSEPAELYDPHLTHFVADKGDENWPEVVQETSLGKIGSWVTADSFLKSLSISYRYDQQSGFSVAFPLFIVKNAPDPIGGGWFVNRIYFKDWNLRDFSWNLMYAVSASRWIDSYFTAGWEWGSDGTNKSTDFMVESGVKLRFSIAHSPLKFLSPLSDFWGVRVGVKNFGLTDWDYLGYIVEVGAGNF